MAQPDQKSTVPPPANHHELRTADNSAAYLLPKLRSMKEQNPKLTVLDVGAGAGTISATLAKIIPDGHVTATDVSKDILPRAQAIAEMSGVKNIEFQQADVYQLPFADGTFDVTHCHQVLAHLKAPWDALREMLRVTKPGGVVAAREGDYETECVWPELPGLAKFHKLITAFLNATGGSPTAGRQVISWALKAGVSRDQISLTYGTFHFSTSVDKNIWAQAMMEQLRGGRLRKAGLDLGLVEEDDLQEMEKDWEIWSKDDHASLGMMSGEILIQKLASV